MAEDPKKVAVTNPGIVEHWTERRPQLMVVADQSVASQQQQQP